MKTQSVAILTITGLLGASLICVAPAMADDTMSGSSIQSSATTPPPSDMTMTPPAPSDAGMPNPSASVDTTPGITTTNVGSTDDATSDAATKDTATGDDDDY